MSENKENERVWKCEEKKESDYVARVMIWFEDGEFGVAFKGVSRSPKLNEAIMRFGIHTHVVNMDIHNVSYPVCEHTLNNISGHSEENFKTWGEVVEYVENVHEKIKTAVNRYLKDLDHFEEDISEKIGTYLIKI